MTGFEWDPEKAAQNLIDHKVSFEQAVVACLDPCAVEWIDEREDYGEERCGLLGLYRGEVIYVAYTERSENTRFIMARRAERHEKDRYYRQDAP